VPREDAARLTLVIAEKAVAEIFRVDGTLMLLQDGKFVPVNPGIMRAIVAKHIKTIHWINQGTADSPRWQIEFVQFEFPAGGRLDLGPDERTLIDMTKDLTQMVARGPAKPIDLSFQQIREIGQRLKQGEPVARIAEAYKVEPDVVREISRAA
jgi:hypothetical protein